jgi:hypothetical protein
MLVATFENSEHHVDPRLQAEGYNFSFFCNPHLPRYTLSKFRFSSVNYCVIYNFYSRRIPSETSCIMDLKSLTAVTISNTIVWDVTPWMCSNLQVRKIGQASNYVSRSRRQPCGKIKPNTVIEQFYGSCRASRLYSEVVQFESWPGNRISLLKYFVFLLTHSTRILR